MELDDQMRNFQTLIMFTYELMTDEEDGMIRWEVIKQLTKFTYILVTDEKKKGMGLSDEVFKQLTNLTYELETNERLGWDDQKTSIQTIE